MNYYERHIGDYLKDTAHLSLLHHGIYARLLDVYYTREHGFAEGEAQRLIGARAKDERTACDEILAEFFDCIDGAWQHKRCEAEIARYRDKQNKAKASANARWSNTERSPNAMRTHTEGNALQSPDTRPIEEKAPSVLVALRGDTYRVPDCPYEDVIKAYHEVLPMLPAVVVINTARKASIRARWVEVCAAEKFGTEAGSQWFRDFFANVARSAFLTGRGKGGWKADLEWLMGPKNFAKAVEGRYLQERA